VEATDTHELLIFLHIPKAGGSTLHRILEREYRGRKIYDTYYGVEYEDELEQMPLEVRSAVVLLKGHMHFGLHRLFPQRSRYMTMLRDPVERIVSLYYYARRHPEHYLHAPIVDGRLDVRAYASSGLSDELENGQVRLLSLRARELGDCDRPCLEEAKQNLLAHFPVAGLTERFDESVLLLRRAFGWRLPVYAQANAGDRSARDRLDPETRQVLEERNRLDFELYRFAAERLDAQIAAAGSDFLRELRRFQRINAAAAFAARRTARARRALRGRLSPAR